MSKHVEKPESFGKRFDEVDRSDSLSRSCSSPSSSSIQSYATTTNSGACSQQQLSVSSDPLERGAERTQLVVSEPTVIKRSVSSVLPFSVNNSIGCVLSGLGSVLQGPENRRVMVSIRAKVAHKCFRVEGSKASHNLFSSDVPRNIHPHADGQYSGINLLDKNGGTRNEILTKLGDLELSFGAPDHDYCGILARGAQRGGR